MQAHNLGYPRIGDQRQLKFALERYWRGETDRASLETTARALRARHWRAQQDAGLDWIPVGDFSLYDQVLDHSVLFGVVPERFGWDGKEVDLDLYFRMARGCAPTGEPVAACEMTKWFDTNYHYLVPEVVKNQRFHLSSQKLFQEVEEAKALAIPFKPVLLGPLTWLWLAKPKGEAFDRLELLEGLLEVYGQVLARLEELGAEWVQIDEPILVLDLPPAWRQAFESTYHRLHASGLKLLLATYYGALEDNLGLAMRLPVSGIHLDLARGGEQLQQALDLLPPYKVLSAGVIDGRNVWRAELDPLLTRLEAMRRRLGDERLWLAPSCSLLHLPVDLDSEEALDDELRGWLAFARQKLDELVVLRDFLRGDHQGTLAKRTAARQAWHSRRTSPRIHDPQVAGRLRSITPDQLSRARPFVERRSRQRAWLKLPLFPTTTIGSFPQTAAIRQSRRDHRIGKLSEADYVSAMHAEIARVIRKQEEYGLDVLVHGEPERNDMVEYFGEQLRGFAFTRRGWVQSYGSRCVKPPILYGDVSRPGPMTVAWASHAQSLTDKPVKGMLTGPVTILNWSFVRDDQPRADTCLQIALALRDEVLDLEAAGIKVIQIDEAALREGLPLRRARWGEYLDWAVRAFRLAASAVGDETQIHTHMCYSEFNDIIESIAAMDADVITIETSRSQMELLDAFVDFEYPNEIGPGVYDIHSPKIPTVEEMAGLMELAARRIPAERLWVNPDCGLKTRTWEEVEPALRNMVEAAKRLRAANLGRASA